MLTVVLDSAPAAGVTISPAGTAIAGTLSYTVPAAPTRHLVTDLAPGAGYTVTVSTAGSNHVETVAAGGSMTATANGVLSFGVTSGGVLQP